MATPEVSDRIVRPMLRRNLLRLEPGWPLTMLFVGYPVWWLLGLSQVMCLVAAAIMALELARRRTVIVPAAFGVWLLFLAWTMTGPLVAQVIAPGSEPVVEMTHYVTWAYRMSFLVVATVALVYVTTLHLTPRRVGRILSVMFLVVVGGGLLGVVAPHLSFPSAVEVMLPHRLDANIFIHAQVHPTPAELQDYLGRVNARPSAPFAYANEWGLNYAVLLPFFVGTWLAPDAGWRRLAGFGVLAISVVPVIYSLNRGLWAALIVSIVFVAVRSALAGHLRLLAAACVVVAAVPLVILASPLRATIEARFSGHSSNEGRTNLQTLAVTSTATTSPVVGFGATRRVQGTFHSIAQGATTQCPRCSPPALGTQGQLWTVTFSFGLLGALLFVLFLGLAFLRHLRQRSPTDTMCLTVMLVYLVTLPIYDFSYPAMIAMMSAMALLGRDAVRRTTLGEYAGQLTSHKWLVVGTVITGAVIGSVSQAAMRPIYHATVSVEIPPSLSPSDQTDAPTLDDLASAATASAALSTIAASQHVTPEEAQAALMVTATPNSRIMHLTYTATSAASARSGANAAAATFLDQQRTTLAAQQTEDVRGLSVLSDALALALGHIHRAERLYGTRPAVARILEGTVPAHSADAQKQRAEAESRAVDPGRLLGPPSVRHDIDGWLVRPVSGAALGLLLAAGLIWRRRFLTMRLSEALRSGAVAGTRVLATVDRGGVVPAIAGPRARNFLSVDHSPQTLRVTSVYERRITRTRPSSRPAVASSRHPVVLIASRRTRVAQLNKCLNELSVGSLRVSGLVLVDERGRRHAASISRIFRISRGVGS